MLQQSLDIVLPSSQELSKIWPYRATNTYALKHEHFWLIVAWHFDIWPNAMAPCFLPIFSSSRRIWSQVRQFCLSKWKRNCFRRAPRHSRELHTAEWQSRITLRKMWLIRVTLCRMVLCRMTLCRTVTWIMTLCRMLLIRKTLSRIILK